ncbi:MAG: nucleotidyl transferase AbiEii/AbiGii toxin family protein [Pseudomonadales bacterium]
MTFIPNTSTLPKPQRQLWRELRPLADQFVLYGGTAIALRLGHRASVDFDYFTEHLLDIDSMLKTLAFLSAADVLQREPNTLTVSVNRGGPVKLSIFGDISFGRIGTPDRTEDGVAVVASPIDLLATKLKVLLQRIEIKDYLDIEALLRSGVDLAQGLGGAAALYGNAFAPMECVKALVYFQEGAAREVPDGTQSYLRNVAERWDGRVPEMPIIGRSLQ